MEWMNSDIYTIKQVSFQYPFGSQEVLRAIDCSIRAGEFIVLCGASGCGKTTFLRQLKSAIAARGRLQGEICFHGVPLSKVDVREQTARIGYVGQNPEDQIVTDQVWHELAFGMESLGMDAVTIRKRVAEMSHFFGIQDWFHRNVSELSGGQKQLLNLASIMVMQPEILLLDEPTSQLDPIAATEFLTMLHRIHQELGTTILMTEHRLEEVLPYATRLVYMEQGSLIYDGSVDEVIETLCRMEHPYVAALPAPVRIWNAADYASKCPVTVQEGRSWITELARSRELRSMEEVRTELARSREPYSTEEVRAEREMNREKEQRSGKNRSCTVELKHIWFRYGKHTPDILRDASVKAYAGEVFAILGGNGSGKSTLLSMIYKGRKPQRGRVCFPDASKRKVISLPQNPQLLFVCDTVLEELEDMKGTQKNWKTLLEDMISLCRLKHVLNQHPYDLSGGEQQRLGLAKVLLAEPDILLLDEPTKGLDVEYKAVFAEILEQLRRRDVTILMVSHDVEFCAEHADRCALFFDGQIAAEGATHEFFIQNHFYTTQAHRMARHILPEAVTVEEVILACRANQPKRDNRKGENSPEKTPPKETMLDSGQAENNRQDENLPEETPPEKTPSQDIRSGHISKRMLITIGMLILAIPFTIYAGIHYFNDEKYLFISLLILLEAMLPFFLAFEGKKPPARDIVMLAVLCALGVAGRVICAAIPQFQPVTAIAIVAGAAFGGETGFLTGAVTMLVSNIIFGQGPWTPWQMFAMGLVGCVSGVIFYPWTKRGIWKEKSKKSWLGIGFLCIYGLLAVLVFYGGIMNPVAAIMAGEALNRQMLVAYYISGFPFDLIHGVSTVIFLLLGAKPILKKLGRVRIKFGV